jgi:hypothetical protein
MSTLPPRSAHALASQVESEPCSEVRTRVAPSPSSRIPSDTPGRHRRPRHVRELEAAEEVGEPRERDHEAEDREQEARPDVG